MDHAWPLLFPISPVYYSRPKRNRRQWMCKIWGGKWGALRPIWKSLITESLLTSLFCLLAYVELNHRTPRRKYKLLRESLLIWAVCAGFSSFQPITKQIAAIKTAKLLVAKTIISSHILCKNWDFSKIIQSPKLFGISGSSDSDKHMFHEAKNVIKDLTIQTWL